MRKYLTEWCKNPIIKLVKSGKLSQAAVPIERKTKINQPFYRVSDRGSLMERNGPFNSDIVRIRILFQFAKTKVRERERERKM